MYKVYILKSISRPEKSYVGYTIKRVQDRLQEHNEGLTQSTKAYRPWKLLYYETFYCKLCAEKREKLLKSGIGFRFRKMILENF